MARIVERRKRGVKHTLPLNRRNAVHGLVLARSFFLNHDGLAKAGPGL